MHITDRRRLMAMGAAALLPLGAAQAAEAPVDSEHLGFTPDAQFVAKARRLLDRVPAIDLHAHPGRTFGRGAVGLSAAAASIIAGGPFEDRAIADMRAGGVSGASFAAVADMQILDARGTALAATRDFAPGEAQASYGRQIANLKTYVQAAGARLVREPGDFARFKRRGEIGALLTVEGADFLGGELAGLGGAFADGVRSITLVHYHSNPLGETQTAPGASQGLTAFGREVVSEMGRLGMIVDVAHAAEPVVRGVLAATDRPVMCSHTFILGRGTENPRFISPALAREIAAQGGVIGAWPAGIGAATLNDYVDRIFQLAETVGPEHVALGTDMDANFRPVMTSYLQLPLVVSELLRRGYGEAQVRAFLSGNFLRVFGTVWRRRGR
ncbi:dipeptidase [Phenylobacterium aquaticum]|uniref:dipeptidase n=1 Tax=Phenylobacterium aquaticum TaxID=1763816 RepID=UPI001F5D4C2A|nr:membrane dipeptidase [Phenylobacterium aquaticum]MCI3132121.1 dipeptidase [Phenylobacterium aquaticum]